MLWLARRLGISRATLWTARTEVEAFAVRWRGRAWLPARRELKTLRAQRGVLLNVGSGPFVLDGFVNLELRAYHPDVVRWDCRRTLPVGDASCAGIRIEHFVEHLDPRDELPFLFADCYRALQPGGVLRVIVPDAARWLRAYVNADSAEFRRLAVPDPYPDDLPTDMDVLNHVFYQWHEHRWAFDVTNLSLRFREAGFREIATMSFRESRLPALAADRDEHAPYSLYMDAIKCAG
jgi:predicted SAM-dependent methyltransferase